MLRLVISSTVSVTRRKRSDCWPTRPAIHVPGPSERTVSTSIGSLNSGPVRICPSWMVAAANGCFVAQILRSGESMQQGWACRMA